MSDFFATEEDTQQARIDAALEPQRRVGFWEDPQGDGDALENVLPTIGSNIALGGAGLNTWLANANERLFSGLGQIDAGGWHPDDPYHESDLTEFFKRNSERLMQDYRNLRVDPTTRSEAANMIADTAGFLARFAAPAVVGGPAGIITGPAGGGTGTGLETQADMLAQGVDPETARGAAQRSGVVTGAMAMAPVSVPGRLLTRLGTGAALGAGFGALNRGVMHDYLDEQGYPELAAQYQWADGQSAAIDAIFGAAFGGLFGRRAPARLRPHIGEARTEAGAQTLPPDADGYFDEARQYGTDEQYAEAYAYALVARELGHPEADGLISLIEEDAGSADLDAGRAMAEEIAQGELSRALRNSDLPAAAMIEADNIQRETAFGIPADHQSARWQADALSRMEEQAARDEPLDPGQAPEGVEFIPRPESPDALEALRAEMQARGIDPDEVLYSTRDADGGSIPGRLGPEAEPPKPVNSNNDITTDRGAAMEMMEEAQPIIAGMFDQMRVDRNAPAAGRAGARWGTGATTDPDVIIAAARESGELDKYDVPGAIRLIAEQAGDDVAMRYLQRFDEQALYRNIKSNTAYVDHPEGTGWTPSGAEEMRRFLLEWSKLKQMPDEEAVAIARQRGVDVFQIIEENYARNRQLMAQRLASPRPNAGEYSVSDNQGGAPVELLANEFRRVYGADAQPLIDAGKAKLVNTASELPFPVPDNVAAAHYRGQSYFIADRMTPEQMAGKALHEIGWHGGMENFIGKRAYNEINRQIGLMLSEGHPLVREAVNRAMRADGIDRLNSEAGAYLVERAQRDLVMANLIESAPEMPLVQRVLSQLRQWLIKTFGRTFGMRLTVDDIRQLAVASLRRASEQARRETGEPVPIGQNGEFPLFSTNGRTGRDPIEAPDYQARVGRLQETLGGNDASGESGASRGERDNAPVKDGDKPDRELAEQTRAAMALSGVRIQTVANPMLGSLRLSFDSPVELPARMRDALQERPDARTHNTEILFDVVEGGKLKADPSAPEGRRDGVYLRWTSTPDALRRSGLGSWMYRQLIDWAHRQGYTVFSDASISYKAWPMYDRLRNMGYDVEQISPTTRDPLTQTHESIDGEPIYAIYPGVRPLDEYGAPPPDGDYQIDGPTLRDRQKVIEDQRRAQEQFDKLPPAEQAMADDPGMQFSVRDDDPANGPDAGRLSPQPLRRTEDREIAANNFFPVAEDMAQADTRPVDGIRRRMRDMTPAEADIPLRDLQATQHSVMDDFSAGERSGLPEVYRDDAGRLLIMDGHNRAARAAANGDETIRVRLFGERPADSSAGGGRMGPSGKPFVHDHLFGDRYEITDGEGGSLSYAREPNAWHVREIEVPPLLRRQGRGIALYEEFIQRAHESGIERVTSDRAGRISIDAQNIYAALKRRGWDVAEHVDSNGERTFSVATRRASARHDGGSASAERLGPSLADMVDDEGFQLGGGGSLIIGALRRAHVDLHALESAGLADRPMPQRSLQLNQIRGTDHTPPEQQWVDYYSQNQGEPIVVRRNRRGGYDVIDGHHRLEAARRAGNPTIEAYDASQYFERQQPNAGSGDDFPQFSRTEPRERRMRAQELMERVAAQKKQASEMRRGLEAAAACAVRAGLRSAPTTASFVTLRATAASALPSADAALGQVIGMTYAIPLGITFAPILAQSARRSSPQNSSLWAWQGQAMEGNFRDARASAERAGGGNDDYAIHPITQSGSRHGVAPQPLYDYPAPSEGFEPGLHPEGFKVPPAPPGLDDE